jgi:hypothetical protein
MKLAVAWLEPRNGGYNDALDQSKIARYLALPASTAPPIVVETNGQIFDGHHRFAVAKLRGLTEVDCIPRDGAGRGNS